MTPQAPVFYGGKCNIRLGVTSIYGMKRTRPNGASNTIRPLIKTVLL